METMENALVKAGYKVWNIDYPSRTASIQQLGETVVGDAVRNELAFRRAAETSPILTSVNLELTNHCNLRCTICPVNTTMRRPKGFMDPALFRRIIDESHAEATRLLTAHRAPLDALAQALLERETLNEEEILAVTGLTPAKVEEPIGAALQAAVTRSD